MPAALTIPWRAVALAVAINLLWGGQVPAVKLGLLAIPPLWSAFWRFVLGAACLAVWARLNGAPLRPPRSEWSGLAVLGLLFTAQMALMNLGIRYTSGAMASVLVATNPLFAALLSHAFTPGDRLNTRRTLGLAVAFAGICVVFLRDALAGPDAAGALAGVTWQGNALCLACALLLGGRLVFTAHLLQRMETSRVLVWQMLLSLPSFALAGALTEQVRWEALGWVPLAGIAYQGIVVAGFNFMALAWLLRRYPPSVVVGYNFLSPVFGVLLSLLLLGETLTAPLLAGFAGVGLGLYLITRR